MKLGILLGLLVIWGGPQLAASITLMRPNVLKLEVSSHLQSGAEIYHLNENIIKYVHFCKNLTVKAKVKVE